LVEVGSWKLEFQKTKNGYRQSYLVNGYTKSKWLTANGQFEARVEMLVDGC